MNSKLEISPRVYLFFCKHINAYIDIVFVYLRRVIKIKNRVLK
jgi:hypothetical protein